MSAKRNGANGHDNADERPKLILRSALEIAARPAHAEWLLKPYIESSAMILMVGAEGTYKSFLALHWALLLAMSNQAVIFLHAEGRGLWKRLRAWCMHHYPLQFWGETLNGRPFNAVERPLNLSSLATVQMLIAAIDALGRRPALIVVDTMTRNSDGTIERSNEDATGYLNMLDMQIRARYGASVLLIHHIGHAVKDRARGPFSLIASTDANFLLERPDPVQRIVTVRSGRMKDCEPPAPFNLEAKLITLDEVDSDGNPETSLVLADSGQAPSVVQSRPTGKAQRTLLAELERRARDDDIGIWTEGELREIGRGLGLHRNSARDAVLGLRTLGYFIATVGGSRLAHAPEQRTK